MRYLLDGNDWKAGYFVPESKRGGWRNISNMLMDSALSAGIMGSSCPDEALYPATVPGCDRSVLLENHEIADPYYGRNMEHSRWSEQMEWAFRKDFVLPPEMCNCRRFTLVFHCAGYSANVFLNTEYLGPGEGMFAAWTYDISQEILRTGTNTLVLIFKPAPQASPNHKRGEPSEFAYFRQCQMSFGWDWARPLVPTGIFDHVEIVASDNARVRDCAFRTQKRHVLLDLEFGTLEDANETLSLDMVPVNHNGAALHLERQFAVRGGETTRTQWEFDFEEAQLWYPNGYGAQPLYELVLRFPGDEWRRLVGFRDLEMKRNPGSPEEAYPLTFMVNGKKIFARGANWVPADMIFSRIDDALYEREIRLLKEAGFNLLRVWGGGIVEKEDFYAACDKYGILVWQEFPHSCSSYPCDGQTLANRTRDGEAIIRKIRNHVSMAMYCGGNEMQYYGELPDNPIYLKYRELVEKLAPGMPFHVASPDLSRPGERHHGPWQVKEHAFWNKHHRLLASEAGCNGWAELDSIEKFIPPNDPCPGGQHWKYHFTIDTPSKPLTPLLEDFRPKANGWRQMCDMTMFAQADQLGYAMEHYRSLYPLASGCFIWQYNESWPTNSFSIIDYYTRPKMSYYRLSRANQSCVLFLEDESWHVADACFNGRLKLLSDKDIPGEAKILLSAMDIAGKKLFDREYASAIAEGCLELGSIEEKLPQVPNGLLIVRLQVLLEGKCIFDNERIFGCPNFNEAFSCPETRLSMQSSTEKLPGGETLLDVSVRNEGNAVALHVRVDLPDNRLEDVFWQDNYRSILPGETRHFLAKLKAETKPGAITARGWNCECK